MFVLANEKVAANYWRSTHWQPRWRSSSRLNIATKNLLGTVSGYTRPGMRVLEIGCAPGKYLAYLAKVQKATICGLDYSEPGIAFSRQLFSKLKIPDEFRCEDIFATTFHGDSFDLVYSPAVIEHFEDARAIVD